MPDSWIEQRGRTLQVRWREASAFGDTRQHSRSDLFVVVECEHEIRPAVTLERSMGTGLPLDPPANPNEGGQHAAGPGGRPAAHAAWKVTLRNSAGASRCSRRSAITRSASAWTRATASSRSWPYAMTPAKAGTSASQRPSSSRSISIVNVTVAMYHSSPLSNKAASRSAADRRGRAGCQRAARVSQSSFTRLVTCAA